MSNKLIKNIDEETWRKFVAYCKFKNVKAGTELNEILQKHIEKKLRILLR